MGRQSTEREEVIGVVAVVVAAEAAVQEVAVKLVVVMAQADQPILEAEEVQEEEPMGGAAGAADFRVVADGALMADMLGLAQTATLLQTKMSTSVVAAAVRVAARMPHMEEAVEELVALVEPE
jgi:hypothetical protein